MKQRVMAVILLVALVMNSNVAMASERVEKAGNVTMQTAEKKEGQNYTNIKEKDSVALRKAMLNLQQDNKVIALGDGHSAAITDNGDLYCWGYNSYGQLGDGTSKNQKIPVKVLDNVVSVKLDCVESFVSETLGYYSAAITNNGDLYCWGYNNYGQVGNGTTENQKIPVKILTNVVSVDLCGGGSLALTSNGSLYRWGKNEYGQVGDGMTIYQSTPVKFLDNVVAMDRCATHSAAITSNGDLYCWGYNGFGQVGNGLTVSQSIPVKVLEDVVSIDLYGYRSAAVTSNGDLYCWGRNTYGELGDGTTNSSSVPVKVLENVVSVDLGRDYSAAVTSNGDLYCWGDNTWGQLGDGTTNNSSLPVRVLKNVIAVDIGRGGGAVAITSDGDLYCWGYNTYGQVGNGTTNSWDRPVKVLNNVVAFDLGVHQCAAVMDNGDLYCWGRNNYGQVGDGTTTDRSSPVKVLGGIMSANPTPPEVSTPPDDTITSEIGSFTLTPTVSGILNEAVTFSGTIYLKDGTTATESEWENIINEIAWTSSDSSVADNVTVQQLTGVGETAYSTFIVSVQPKAEGSTTITGTLSNGMTASCVVFVADKTDSDETVVEPYIIQRVSKYTSDTIYEEFDRINKSNCSMEERYQKYYDLFVHYGFTNVKEGISYLSNTTAERYAYLMLTTDDCFIASQYKNELKTNKKMESVLKAEGLIFNSEWKTWVNPLTYTEGETPGVKKYKEMLYDYMGAQSKKFEAVSNIKTITKLLDNVTGTVKDTVLKEIENCDSSEFWAIIEKYKDGIFDLEIKDNNAGEVVSSIKFDTGDGFGKFVRAEGYASLSITAADMFLEDVIALIQLNGKLAAYEENREFLNEVIKSADDIPSELRYAAYLVRNEMEAGLWNNAKDFVLDIVKMSKITEGMLKTVLEKYGFNAAAGIAGSLTSITKSLDVAVWFSNQIVSMNKVIKKAAYVEGYAYLAEHFRKILERNKQAFLQSKTQENAWKFYYTYNTLYQIRFMGEEAYRDMCNVQGLASELAKSRVNYTLRKEAVDNILAILEERCQFILPNGMEMPKSVSYYLKAVVRCPVDVEVLDIRGNSIVRLSDRVESDVVNQYGRFAVIYDSYTGDYIKVICLNSSENVSIQIKGQDKGLVNMEFAQAEDFGNKIYAFNNVPVSRGTIIETTVNKIVNEKTYDVDVDGDGIADEEGIVNVKQDSYCPIEYISLDKSTLILNKGESDILGVTVSPSNATEQRVSWMSADSSVATVINGKVTAVAEGSTIIYCVALAAKDKVASCKINVTSLTASPAPTVSPTPTASLTPSTVPTVVPDSTSAPTMSPDDTGIDILDVAEVTLENDSYIYNGKPKEPEVIVQTESEYLEEDIDYIVSYKNNSKVGVASVIITGIGKYTGQITNTFKIFPKGTSLSGKVKETSRGFVVKWKKQAKCTTGYQVQYSTSKKFAKKATITKTIKKKSVTKLTVRKLKAIKRYYVRVRVYKIVGGGKYYSSWSKSRSIKTKGK